MAKHPRSELRISKAVDRHEFAAALELASLDPASPEYNAAIMLRRTDKSPSLICKEAGLTYSKMVMHYRDMKRNESIVRVAQHLPQVVEDTAIDAMAKDNTCTACEGEGKVIAERDDKGKPTRMKKCIPCEGRGKVRVPGDATARKHILEMMELAGKGQVNINAPNSQMLVAGGGLEETLKAARQKAPPTIEASE